MKRILLFSMLCAMVTVGSGASAASPRSSQPGGPTPHVTTRLAAATSGFARGSRWDIQDPPTGTFSGRNSERLMRTDAKMARFGAGLRNKYERALTGLSVAGLWIRARLGTEERPYRARDQRVYRPNGSRYVIERYFSRGPGRSLRRVQTRREVWSTAIERNRAFTVRAPSYDTEHSAQTPFSLLRVGNSHENTRGRARLEGSPASAREPAMSK